jgi:integrase
MSRTKAKDTARTRILTDTELKAVWKTADGSGVFGSLIQFLLLTAVRRSEAAEMIRAEVAGSLWTIPAERMKAGLDHLVPLSAVAVAILDRLPGAPFPFTMSGDRPMGGLWTRKIAFDKACGVTAWTFHDCRRTSRSLMSRAGVPSEIGERCLAHLPGGVKGIYDRYEYLDEKREALGRLARLVGEIVGDVA